MTRKREVRRWRATATDPTIVAVRDMEEGRLGEIETDGAKEGGGGGRCQQEGSWRR